MTAGGLRVRVLGAPSIADDWPQLAPREADLLVTLALSPGGRQKDWLWRHLWSRPDHDDPSAVTTCVGYLKQKGVAFERTGRGDPYRLAYDSDAIDSRRFVRLVNELPDRPEPAALDALLGMWTGNPWERRSTVPPGVWAEVRGALQRVLGTVATLGDHGRVLRRWGTFEQMFAGDPLLDEVRSPVPRPPRPGVLIVDDQIGQEMADVLGDYDTEVIGSLAQWNRRKDDGRPFRHVCALVDLHLKREMTDRGGLEVVRFLRERTRMPIVLMSAELPPFQDSAELCTSLGIAKVLPKHNRARDDLTRVGDVVRRLAG